MFQSKIITWTEPNRENAPPLNIESRGVRYPTLSGVAWLDEFRYAVVHRCGLRLAVFDTRHENTILAGVSLPHRVDDIAAKSISPDCWELCVTGCWDASHSVYQLKIHESIELSLLQTYSSLNRTFSHGVRYDHRGKKCLSFSTGNDPRTEIDGRILRIPNPWGPRNICFDHERDSYWMIAVSDTPKLHQYQNVSASIWILTRGSANWTPKLILDDAHVDCCEIYGNKIWISDQKSDRVLGICLNGHAPPVVIQGACFSFPHGLSISSLGTMAVTNYGNSSVAFIDLNQVIQKHNESHQAPK